MKLQAYSQKENLDFEIIVCGELIDKKDSVGANFFKVIPSKKGACVRTGVFKSKGSIIIVCDADCPININDLTTFRLALKDHDVAYGNRYLPSSKYTILPPFTRRYASIFFRNFIQFLFNLKFFDTQCGVKGFRRSAALSIFATQLIPGLAFDVEATLRSKILGLRMAQIPVNWKHSNKSTVSLWRDVPPMIFDIIKLKFIYKFIH